MYDPVSLVLLEERVRSTDWLVQRIPEERFREESVRRAIAAAKKLMLVSPDEVQRKVVEEAMVLRERLPEIEEVVEVVPQAQTISLLLMLLAALEELRDGEHGGDIAEAISFAIREEIDLYQHNMIDIEEFEKGLGKQIDSILRVYRPL